ncbi:MAG TPA: MotA/TolQ/ExbB proton channel family protein [Chitinivibrionales bacterium]|nr:MotA/TolQ/ExbB proton channel family protein [Chitinivibrionales bacterium]
MNIPIVDMILRSGWVARSILVLLGIFSIVTWAVIFNRFYYLGRVSKRSRLFFKKYLAMTALTDVEKADAQLLKSPMGQLGAKGAGEFRRIIDDSKSHSGVSDWSFFLQNQFAIALERIDTLFSEISRKLDTGLILLAISSSVCPFLGLLGTVWGIMDSFYEIGNQGSASLPVVAPGIAEALVVTLVGLGVAIPAVLFYNYFVHQVDRVENELSEYKNLMFSHLKRDILSVLYRDKHPGKPAA